MRFQSISVGHYLTVMAVCFLTVYRGGAQAPHLRSSSPAAVQDKDRSFNVGRPVPHPEEISGLWEAPDGRGGAVGLHLMLDTTARADATTLVGAKQLWLDLQVGLYERPGHRIQIDDQNSFSDSPRGGGVRLEKGRLTLHDGEFDLDLKRMAGDKWRGRFHRKGFDAKVTLVRPGSVDGTKKLWLAGTWRLVQEPRETCLHVAQTYRGGLIGWSDSLLTLGGARFGPNVTKPTYSLEHYGEVARIRAVDNKVSIELNANTAVCCSHLFTAAPAQNGTTMLANWEAGPNQTARKTKWKKMPGNSCIVSAP